MTLNGMPSIIPSTVWTSTPGAVEIAKLRLWLSLVVDEEDREKDPAPPQPGFLKLCRETALLEEFEGIKLFDENLFNKRRKSNKVTAEEIDLLGKCEYEDENSYISRLKKKEKEIQKKIRPFYSKDPSLLKDWDKKSKKVATCSTARIRTGIKKHSG